MHGFDEFFGNLYHLNAEEEPEHADYPPADEFPDFRKRFGPRGVIHSWANERRRRSASRTPGPLTKKRMETIDDEVFEHAVDFIERQHDDEHAVLPLVQHDAHALPDARRSPRRWGGPGAGSRRTTT